MVQNLGEIWPEWKHVLAKMVACEKLAASRQRSQNGTIFGQNLAKIWPNFGQNYFHFGPPLEQQCWANITPFWWIWGGGKGERPLARTAPAGQGCEKKNVFFSSKPEKKTLTKKQAGPIVEKKHLFFFLNPENPEKVWKKTPQIFFRAGPAGP